MKLKQILFTVVLSVATTLAVIWGYGTFFKKDISYAGQQPGVIPANYKYAGLLDGNNTPNGVADFTIPAETATPAVVHIKTKTNAACPANSNLIIHSVIFLMMICSASYLAAGAVISYLSKEQVVQVLSSVMMDILLPTTT